MLYILIVVGMPTYKWQVLFAQIIRYVIVGVLNNLCGYILYLLLTWVGLDPKMVVSMLYPIGALTAYWGHARFSFNTYGLKPNAIRRFIVAHILGFLVNLMMLVIMVDFYGYSHALIQMLAIVTVAGVLFILFRYYVFVGESQILNDDNGG